MDYTIEKRIPENYTRGKWCICRDGEIIAHYDRVGSCIAGYKAVRRAY
jgi:hypothetical protein